MRRPALLTTTGLIVAALGVLAYVGGWRLGWVELMVLAAGSLLALAFAIPFVIGRVKLDVVRSLEPERVMVGDRAKAVLDITNPGRTPIRRRFLEDAIGDQPMTIEIGPLGPGDSTHAVYELPTSRRGLVRVGPAVIARQDPLQIMRRDVAQTGAQDFWVHPRYEPVAALPVGFAKDLEGPTSDTSPMGDVAFHALREYEPGDDYRHIHWMSTARTGIPVVRHYVDNRRPELLVVLDDRATAMSVDQFEVAVEIAASLAVSSMLHQQPVAVWSTADVILGRTNPGGRNDVLDRLTTVHQVELGDLHGRAMHASRNEPNCSAVVVVTGGSPAEELMLLVGQLRRRVRVVIVRVWPADEIRTDAIPGAKVIDVDTLDRFRRGWARVAR
jgi:uncharacterized protein (DUF58 family)